MPLLVLIIIAFLGYGMLRTHFSVRQSRGARERAVATRFAIFTWLVGFLFAALLFLPVPGKQRLLFIAPIFFGGVMIRKIFTGARERVRRTEQLDTEIERMKRVN